VFFGPANESDRDGSSSGRNIEDAVRSGVVAAIVPKELGGGGRVVSLRDHAAGMTRLGGPEASVAAQRMASDDGTFHCSANFYTYIARRPT
jgi:hypothetical protein